MFSDILYSSFQRRSFMTPFNPCYWNLLDFKPRKLRQNQDFAIPGPMFLFGPSDHSIYNRGVHSFQATLVISKFAVGYNLNQLIVDKRYKEA